MQYDDEREQDDWDEPPRAFGGEPQEGPPMRRRRSQGLGLPAKILIGIGISAVLFCCLCCGGGIYWSMNQKLVPEENRPEAERIAREVFGRDVPPDLFAPTSISSMNFFVFQMRMVFCTPQGEDPDEIVDGLMLIIDLQLPEGVPADELESSIVTQRDQNSRDLQIKSSETRTFKVRGRDVAFQFALGVDRESQKEYRQVLGMIPTDKGFAQVVIQVASDQFNEERIVEFLESLDANGRPPADAADQDEPVDDADQAAEPAPTQDAGESSGDADESSSEEKASGS